MINFWKLAYKSVKEQRDQHKVELQQRKSELYYYRDELESYKTNLKQRKEALEYTRDEVKKFKAENEKLRERNKKLEKRCNQKVRRNVRGGLQQMKIEDLESKCDGMKTENEQYKAERDTLIDDLSWYKAKVSRLERENEKLVWTLKNKEDVIDWNCLKIRGLKEDVEKYKRGIINLANENEQLKQDLLRTEELQDEIIQLEKDFENKHNLLSEFSQHIGNKPSSSMYKYFRAKLDGVGIKEGD